MSQRIKLISVLLIILISIATISVWVASKRDDVAMLDQYKTEMDSIEETLALFNEINTQESNFVLTTQSKKQFEAELLQLEREVTDSYSIYKTVEGKQHYEDIRVLLELHWALLENFEKESTRLEIETEINQQIVVINGDVSQYQEKITSQSNALWSIEGI